MTTANPYWPLPSPDALGGLIGADDVRNAVKDTILTWSPYYLAVVSQRLVADGLIGGNNRVNAPLPDFGTWENEPEFRSLGTGQPAAFLVTSPSTVGTPSLEGNRTYRATWRAQVVLQVFGTQWEEAADLTSWYEKATRWCILQHRSLGQFAIGTKWVGNQYSGKVHTSSRTEAQCVMAFDVAVADVIDVRGPSTVPAVPGPPNQDPTVLTTGIELVKVPDDETLPGVADQFEAEED